MSIPTDFKPADYAEAYGRLSCLIQHLGVRAKFAPREALHTDIEWAVIEERTIRERIDALHAANMESLKP